MSQNPLEKASLSQFFSSHVLFLNAIFGKNAARKCAKDGKLVCKKCKNCQEKLHFCSMIARLAFFWEGRRGVASKQLSCLVVVAFRQQAFLPQKCILRDDFGMNWQTLYCRQLGCMPSNSSIVVREQSTT